MKTNHKLSSRIKVLSGTLFMLLFSSHLYGQTYSNEEQELIDHITNCWDAWEEGVGKDNPEIWYEKCPSKPDASFWWTEDGAPEQTAKIRNRNQWHFVRQINHHWLDIRPVAIRIWDDIGMVQFYSYWRVNNRGKWVTTEYKRTEVFKNENGTWILLGGQGTPVTKEDAEPFE